MRWLKFTLNKGFRLVWIDFDKDVFSVSTLISGPFFRTATIASCSGPPLGDGMLIETISDIWSWALLKTLQYQSHLSVKYQSFTRHQKISCWTQRYLA